MNRIFAIVLAALAAPALLGAGGSQYPSQRFNKVTAAEVQSGSLALTSGTQTATVTAPDVARWNSLESSISEEFDPVFGASAAGAITGEDIASWNGFAVNSSWLTNAIYPGEVLSLRALNLSRIFGSVHRLLVQGYSDAAWSDNLALNLGASSVEIRAAHLFTNLPFYQTPYYLMLDRNLSTQWLFLTQPVGTYWLAYKFDVPTQVNRVRHYRYGGWGNPWPTFTVWGSDDSTDGADGHWTQLSNTFTLGTTMDAVTTCDFAQNTRAFLWVKIIGAPRTSEGGAAVREIEFESWQPAPDRRFWVDTRGNPGTDGTMSAGSICFTPLDTAPDSPQTGTAYFDNIARKLRVWDGTDWQDAW